MSAYIEPLKIALFIFPLLALAISSIFFVVQYRRYGRFIFFRGLILYSFVFYLLCAYFLVILPLPAVSEVANYTSTTMEWRLGHSFVTFLSETTLNLADLQTYLPALKQSVVLEPIFNVLLIIPFGIYLRYYFKQSLVKTILLSFSLSLFFELTQLSGLYFIYPRPYRLFDVNDLLHNTLGGFIGYLVAPIFIYLLPTREAIDEISYKKGQTVTFGRRFAAYAIDWLFLGFLSSIFSNLTGITNAAIVYILQILLYFMVLPTVTNGQTLGKKVVRIRIVQENQNKISFSAIFKRYSLLYFLYFGLSRISIYLAPLIQSEELYQMLTAILLTFMIWLLQIFFFINISWSFFRKKQRLFYEKLSDTYTVSTIDKKTL